MTKAHFLVVTLPSTTAQLSGSTYFLVSKARLWIIERIGQQNIYLKNEIIIFQPTISLASESLKLEDREYTPL